MQEKIFNKGDVIFRQGDFGDSFFQIEEGAVEVIINYQGKNENKLTELCAGQFFGELAVLEAYPRSATVITLVDGTRVKEIPAKEINNYFFEDPEKIMDLFRHISGRLRSLTSDYQEASAVYEKLSEETKAPDESLNTRIGRILSGLFSRQDQPQISAKTMQALGKADYTAGFSKSTANFNAGTVIFREGEPGRCMYAIHWGRVGIYADYGKSGQKLLSDLLPGQFFGEMGMIDNEPRSAAAVALEDTTLEIIRSEDLKELFEKNPPKVDMILQNLSYRLRRLTSDYSVLCSKIREKQNA